ncbi:EamA family transporter, partial [Brevundimonas denitrificans]
VSILLSFIGFIAYFELQRIAGPVYFSQISYFITLTTMAFGFFLFGESLQWYVWGAVALIFCGLYMVSKSK